MNEKIHMEVILLDLAAKDLTMIVAKQDRERWYFNTTVNWKWRKVTIK